MPKIKVNDIEMYYETYGQGEPLVFIAGFSADHFCWHEVFEHFTDKYQIILLDNRGAGQTDVPKGPYSIEQMADDVAVLCEKLDVTSAHFTGNSMGGYIVQMLAYRHPTLVKSLVIGNSVMVVHSGFHFYLAAQLALLQAQVPLEIIIKTSLSWVYSYQFLAKPGKLDELVQLALANPYPFTLTGYQGQQAALNGFDSRSWIEQITVPTLVLAADQDIVFIEPTVKALAKQIPNAKYYCFENCGHLPQIEYPEQYVKVVKDFIK